MTVIHMSTG